MSRRESLGKATASALTALAVSQGRMRTGETAGESSEGAPNEYKIKMKRICTEEHWAAKRWGLIVLSPQQTVPGYPGGGNGVSRKDRPKPIG